VKNIKLKFIRKLAIFLSFFCFILEPEFLYCQEEWILSGPPGGIVTEIAVIPDNSNTVIAANQAPFTGLMKSSDDGESWEVLDEGLNFDIPSPNTAIHALALDLVFPDTMFISIRSSYSTYGFYRTQNAGENWQIIDDSAMRAITAKNGRVYASPVSGGLLASFDGGENWQDIAPNLPSATHILLDPEHLDTLYVGTYGNGLYRSPDSGSSFEQIGFPDTTIRAFDVVSTDTFSLIVVSAGDIFIGNRVYISLNNGESWIPRNEGLQSEYPLNEVLALVISPDNPDVLYAGTWYGMYKTVDQGLNWFPMNDGLEIPTILFPEPEPVAVLALAMDPNDPNILYAGTDRKGLFKTTNGGDQWSLIGIPATLVTGLSVSPLNPELIYAGAEDGFYVKRDGRWTPTTLWGGETSGIKSVASSPIDSNLVIASYNNAIFTPLVHKSTDGGQTWEMTQMLFDGSDVWNIIFDPIFPERVYGVWWWLLVHTGGLIISDDSGDTWDIVELGEATDLAINPENSDELYLLEISGKVQKSSDRGINWTTIRTETDTSHYSIAIDPFNPENIYLGTYSVWKSPDGGDTWTRTGLNKWVLDLAFDENSGYLYAATYGSGVCFTTDGGETWDSLNVPANPYLWSIDIGEGEDHSIIYVGSFGTGVFEWSEEITAIPQPENDNILPNIYTLLQNYPNPFNERTLIKFGGLKANHVSLKIINIRGQIVRTLVNEYKPAGQYSVYWDGKDDAGEKVASGLYLYNLKFGNFSKTKKLLFIK